MTEHNIGFASILLDFGICKICADDKVINAVPVYIASTGHGPTSVVTCRTTVDDKACAATATGQACEIKACCEVLNQLTFIIMGAFAEYNIALARIRLVIWISLTCADDQIVNAVAVDVAGTGNGLADFVPCCTTVDDKACAAIATGQACEIKAAIKSTGLAEHNIACTGIHIVANISPWRPDDEVIDAISIHITGTGHGHATVVTCRDSVDDKACAAIAGG